MSSPWYKNFWPWFLILLPFSVILATIVRLMIADQYGENPMVVDDYYKEGRGINVAVAKVKAAQKLGIEFNFSHDDNQFTLAFADNTDIELTALTVSFFHSTLAERDLEQVVTADAQGVFRGDLPTNISGKWTITISPFDQSWRLSQNIQLPTGHVLRLKPLTYGV